MNGRGILKSRTAIAVFTCALTAATVGGVSYATSSPAGGSTFYACATATGAIRAGSIRVGTPPTNCLTGETVQSWNAQGQSGAQGPVGQASVVTIGTPADCSNPPPAAVTGTEPSFLAIPSIPGESSDPAHLNQIDVLSWSQGLTGASATGSFCGGAGGGKAMFSPFTITKHIDKASPALMLASAQGTNLGAVTLNVSKQGVDYLTLKFENVLVSSFKTGGSAGSDVIPVDQVTFDYSKLTISYRQQQPGGTFGAPVVSCYDATLQTVC